MKVTAIIYFLLLTILTSAAYGADQLKACGHHDYAPWNWKKGNQIVGVCAEVTRNLFERVGIEVDLKYVGPWARCQDKMQNGEVDVNICAFINDERKMYSKFITTPMGFNENAVFVKKGKEFPFKDWQDLEGKRAGMVIGVSIGEKFDNFLSAHTEVQRVVTFYQNFMKMSLGRIDFIPVGRYSGIAMIEAFDMTDKIVDLPTPILTGNLYISMSKKSPYLHLLQKIEKFMKSEDYYPWVENLLEKYARVYGEDFRHAQLK